MQSKGQSRRWLLVVALIGLAFVGLALILQPRTMRVDASALPGTWSCFGSYGNALLRSQVIYRADGSYSVGFAALDPENPEVTSLRARESGTWRIDGELLVSNVEAVIYDELIRDSIRYTERERADEAAQYLADMQQSPPVQQIINLTPDNLRIVDEASGIRMGCAPQATE